MYLRAVQYSTWSIACVLFVEGKSETHRRDSKVQPKTGECGTKQAISLLGIDDVTLRSSSRERESLAGLHSSYTCFVCLME